MARIRYLAVLTDHPADLAAFYQRYLGLSALGESREGDISLTDGCFNLTFLRRREALGEPVSEIGLHHIGIEVESLEATERLYRSLHPRGVVVKEPGGIHFGKLRLYGPEGIPISLSTTGFGVTDKAGSLPRLRHIAYNALDTDGLLTFFREVFGARELPTSHQWRERGRRNRFAGDGWTNIAIHPFYDDAEGHEARYGINHIGFLVSDLKDRLATFRSVIPVAERPSSRPYAEYRLRDPEGNGFDLSQSKGWEVDIDHWETAETHLGRWAVEQRRTVALAEGSLR